MEKTVNEIGVDLEWLDLIKEAKGIGLSVDEIRLFLTDPTIRE